MTEPTNGSARERARNPKGVFILTQDSVERDAQAAKMRKQGWSHQRISDTLGYGGEGNVRRALKALKESVERPAAQELVDHELDVLDHLIDRTMEVLNKDHLIVQHGRVVLLGEKPEEGGTDERIPILDHAPILQAVATLKALTESRRKLLGLDAAVKVESTVTDTTPGIAERVRQAKERALAIRNQVRGDG